MRIDVAFEITRIVGLKGTENTRKVRRVESVHVIGGKVTHWTRVYLSRGVLVHRNGVGNG